ncbi:hypothetical protein NA78x_001745 [Anatilimnocola sp. NA78]|uniref:hypothetical protein n=1 Tax=Anatilimnocola sp. NA78 TaxID=3415683 RepID=UPI003CE53D5E
MSHCECEDLHPGNTATVELFDVNVNGGELRDDATVTVTVKTLAGAVVANGNAIPMPNFASGAYRGVLPSNLGITSGQKYSVEISATIPGGGDGFWQIDKIAKKRT